MLKFFNRRFFILFIFPFFLGSITVLGFNPFNLLFINVFSMSMLFYLIYYVKKKTQSSYRKKPFLKNLFFLGSRPMDLVFFFLDYIGFHIPLHLIHHLNF